MYLTQKNHVRNLTKQEYLILRLLTKLSKNLFNVTNYTIRQYYELNNKFLRYESAYHLVKNNDNYKHLPAQIAQQTMRVVDRSFRSFFSVLTQKRKGNYDKPVNIPSFLPFNEYFPCIFSQGNFKVMEDGRLRLSLGQWITKEYGTRYIYFKIPPNVTGHAIKEIRILPQFRGTFFEIEWVYWQDPIPTDLDADKVMGIDLGLDNFATCTSTSGTSFIIEGKGLKSYNRWWNKQRANLQSTYAKNGVKFGKKMYFLNQKRKYKLNEFLNQSVNCIVKQCIAEKVGNVAIGELKDIKQHGHLGHETNQHFQSIPYYLFKQKLASKCELYGIAYQEVDEAYTSQTCYKCGRVRKANRIHRGLYRCDACGIVVNADTNGSINIGNQVAPESNRIGSSGVVNAPYRVTLISFGVTRPTEAPAL
jgi:IS605 OrfB family transposase